MLILILIIIGASVFLIATVPKSVLGFKKELVVDVIVTVRGVYNSGVQNWFSQLDVSYSVSDWYEKPFYGGYTYLEPFDLLPSQVSINVYLDFKKVDIVLVVPALTSTYGFDKSVSFKHVSAGSHTIRVVTPYGAGSVEGHREKTINFPLTEPSGVVTTMATTGLHITNVPDYNPPVSMGNVVDRFFGWVKSLADSLGKVRLWV